MTAYFVELARKEWGYQPPASPTSHRQPTEPNRLATLVRRVATSIAHRGVTR